MILCVVELIQNKKIDIYYESTEVGVPPKIDPSTSTVLQRIHGGDNVCGYKSGIDAQ